MATVAQVRGYLLEEVLAWLLRASGYQLVTAANGDPALSPVGASLAVQGRGAKHQADVLGEFPFTPPFSLPIRIFVEAKSYRPTMSVGLEVIRNAWATVGDVNEFDPKSEQYRYRYVYTLFSTSGFTGEAVAFAWAHQISLVDLSLPMYDTLRHAVAEAAAELSPHVVGAGTVESLRRTCRHVLGTDDEPMLLFPGWGHVHEIIERLREDLEDAQLLIGFPPGPFAVVLIGDVAEFQAHTAEVPDRRVRLSQDSENSTATGWLLRPVDGGRAYRLQFSMSNLATDALLARPRQALTVYSVRNGVPAQIRLDYSFGQEQ